MPRTHTIWTLAVTLLLLAAPGHDSARADDAPFDELPSRVRQMLERYATDCYRVGKDVWVKDPEVWKDRELNSEPIPPIDDGKKKKKRKPEYLPESQWRGKKPAAFKPGQLIAPGGYNLRTGEYVGELHATATSGPDAEALRRQLTLAEAKEADAKARLDAAKAEGSEAKLRLLQPIYDKAHREAESLRQEVGDNVVTGRDVYALITEHNATLPDFYTVRLLHAPAISQRRPMRVNGINTVKTVQVRPAIYKHEWRLRPHAISMALGRRDNRQERVEKFDAVKIAQREAELKQAWSTGKGEARRVGAQRLMLFYAFETETPEKASMRSIR